MYMLTMIVYTVYVTLMQNNMLRGCLLVKGNRKGRVLESRTPLTLLSRALFGHSELRLERMICYQLIDFILLVR